MQIIDTKVSTSKGFIWFIEPSNRGLANITTRNNIDKSQQASIDSGLYANKLVTRDRQIHQVGKTLIIREAPSIPRELPCPQT